VQLLGGDCAHGGKSNTAKVSPQGSIRRQRGPPQFFPSVFEEAAIGAPGPPPALWFPRDA